MKKVTVYLHYGLHPMEISSTGIKFNSAFVDRLYEKEEYFRERIILAINEIAGNEWKVCFREIPDMHPAYRVDITAQDQYLRDIMLIIAAAFPEIELEFWKPQPYFLLGKRARIVDAA